MARNRSYVTPLALPLILTFVAWVAPSVLAQNDPGLPAQIVPAPTVRLTGEG